MKRLTLQKLEKYKRRYQDALVMDTSFWLDHGFREGQFFPCLLSDGSRYDDCTDATSTLRALHTLSLLEEGWPAQEEGEALPLEKRLHEEAQRLLRADVIAEEEAPKRWDQATLQAAVCAFARVEDAARVQRCLALVKEPLNLLEEAWSLDAEAALLVMKKVPIDEQDHSLSIKIETVLQRYSEEERDLLLFYPKDAEHTTSFDKRLVSAGAAMHFLARALRFAQRAGRRDLCERCVLLLVGVLHLTWDEECGGGLFLWRGTLGLPLVRLDWDRKLCWVHLEALCALSSAYEQTGDVNVGYWFYKLHHYTWSNFRDAPNAGFWEALSREGEPLAPCKGSPAYAFHSTTRTLLVCTHTLNALVALHKNDTEVHEPGMIHEGALLKLGGFFKKSWTTRWAAVKNVDTIGKLIEWRDSKDASYIHHWIPFDMLQDVIFEELDDSSYTMELRTQWRSYAFTVPSFEEWMEWKEALADVIKKKE